MGARRGSGGHRPPPRWQVTVNECRECPVRSTPSGSFRALATSVNQLARVARASRMNGHTAIAGGRCLDAGIMPPPRSRSIARSSVRLRRTFQFSSTVYRQSFRVQRRGSSVEGPAFVQSAVAAHSINCVPSLLECMVLPCRDLLRKIFAQ